MVGPSLNVPKPQATATIKFLCSYAGRIVPRYPDGKLRYHGGETRVLAVVRSISFSELLVKLGELCGTTVSLRCQLPTEDLDALVSITCDEDLVNLLEEYDQAGCLQSSSLKIRAFLSLPKKSSPNPSITTATAIAPASRCGSGSGSGSGFGSTSSSGTPTLEVASPGSPPLCASYSAARFPVTATNRCAHPMSNSKPPVKLPFFYNKSTGKLPYYAYRNSNRSCLVPNGNHWQ